MQAVSPPAISSAIKSTPPFSKWRQSVRTALSRAPLTLIVEAIGRGDESVGSRVRSGESRLTFDESLDLLSALGFKAVHSDSVCVRRDKLDALATLAAAAMNDEFCQRRLIWEDEQES